MSLTFEKRIALVKKEFHKEELKKTGKHYSGFNFFQLGDFVPKAEELCEKHNITTLTGFSETHGNMAVLDCESDKRYDITIPLQEAKVELAKVQAVQNLGATITYVRRYLWQCFLDICEHDAMEAGDREGEEEGEEDKSKARKRAEELDRKKKEKAEKDAKSKKDDKEDKPDNPFPTANADNYRKHFLKQINMCTSKSAVQIIQEVAKTYRNPDGTGKKIPQLTVAEMKEILEFHKLEV